MQIPQEYFRAGTIAGEVREQMRVEPLVGRSILEVCEKVEGMIRAKGGDPAFPCNICVNNVTAHNTAKIGDTTIIRDGDVVKVDLGVHINGYIADTAMTISYNPDQDLLVQATETALNEALKGVKIGVLAGEIGRIISATASRMGFRPITNLSGHSLDQYQIHSGISIPNMWLSGTQQLRANEVYAIEPFLTTRDSDGHVVEGGSATIYSLIARRKVGDKRLDNLIEEIWGRRKTLPFTPRWLLDVVSEREVGDALKKLVKLRAVRAYPVLVESKGMCTAQFEHTVIPTESGVVVSTKRST